MKYKNEHSFYLLESLSAICLKSHYLKKLGKGLFFPPKSVDYCLKNKFQVLIGTRLLILSMVTSLVLGQDFCYSETEGNIQHSAHQACSRCLNQEPKSSVSSLMTLEDGAIHLSWGTFIDCKIHCVQIRRAKLSSMQATQARNSDLISPVSDIKYRLWSQTHKPCKRFRTENHWTVFKAIWIPFIC